LLVNDLSQMYNGIRPVRRSVVRVSEMRAPSGVRNEVDTAAEGARAPGAILEGVRPTSLEM